MVSPVPLQDNHDDRRSFARVEMALPAFLQVDGDRHAVHLLDLSAGGAKLVFQAGLAVGTPVTLDCGTLCRGAVIRWKNGDLLGICFNSELDAREVSALTERSRALADRMKTKE